MWQSTDCLIGSAASRRDIPRTPNCHNIEGVPVSYKSGGAQMQRPGAGLGHAGRTFETLFISFLVRPAGSGHRARADARRNLQALWRRRFPENLRLPSESCRIPWS
jgi:hypothetical protein